MSTTDATPKLDPTEAPTVRRAYSTPQLRRLGSVREVTWGVSGPSTEALTTPAPMMAKM